MTEPAGTWRRWLEQRAPYLFLAYWGSRFYATLGLLWDEISQATIDAWGARLNTADHLPAYDALDDLGREQSMPQYPSEDWLQYQGRLIDPWGTWGRAGSAALIAEQLQKAGATSDGSLPFIYRTGTSEFIVFFPAGTHPITGAGPLIGGFTVGDGTELGPAGAPLGWLSSWVGLITHWKPAVWKCSRMVFELSGWTVGTGHVVGEPGLVIGGTQAVAAVQ